MLTNRQPQAPLSDPKLAGKMKSAIESRYGYERLMNWEPDIPIECRIVHFVCASTGYAYCEGYAAYLCMACPHWELPFCFREIGLIDLALLVERMLSPIPKQGVLGNTEALKRHYGGWDNLASWVSPFESKIFEADDRIYCALAGYCRAQADSLVRLGPEIETLLTGRNVQP